jgi:hypothetical protein
LGVAVFIVVEGVWVRGDHPGREAKREVREGKGRWEGCRRVGVILNLSPGIGGRRYCLGLGSRAGGGMEGGGAEGGFGWGAGTLLCGGEGGEGMMGAGGGKRGLEVRDETDW